MITLRMKMDVRSDRRITVVLPPEVPTGPAEVLVSVESHNPDRELVRKAALDQYLAVARTSAFRSNAPYPRRDELHERN